MNRVETFLRNHYSTILGVLASIMVFRKPGTIMLIAFIVLSIISYRSIKIDSRSTRLIFFIAIPVVLDIIFFWNNTEWLDGFKHLEKRVSLLLLPLVIVGFHKKIRLLKVLKIYSILFISILNALFVRFLVLEPDLVQKYLEGIHLWEMGYKFANSTTVHAPALNMHIAFVCVAVTYIITTLKSKSDSLAKRIFWLLFIINALCLLLLVNTRLAMVNAVIGIFLVIGMQLFKKVSPKKLLLTGSSVALLMIVMFFAFAKAFPYVKEKFSRVTFAHMDKVNQLDDFENPEGEVYNSFVTRLSIWNTAYDRAKEDLWTGVGAADGKDELNQAYKDTNQQFLSRWQFPTHNQYLDFLLKFGILGFLGTLIFMFHILWLGWNMKNSLVIFFFILFFTSNLTDDFLIRYDGITFSALWISIFANIYWHEKKYIDQPVI